MSPVTDFITELVRASNDVEKLSKGERFHLLQRGFRMIRELRIRSGTRPIHEQDNLRKLEIAALRTENGTAEEAKSILLGTAALIRDLKIVLDAKAEGLKDR
jgi:hypothetical protein